MKSLHFTLIIFTFLLVGTLFAGLRELPYTGQLYNGTAPIGGTIGQNQKFYFRIYNAKTSGTLLWQSGAIVTQFVKNGFLSINLGDTNVMNALTESIFDEDNVLWLEVQTAPEADSLVTLSPLRKIRTSVYGFDANRLGGIVASQYMRKWTNVVVAGIGGTEGGADFDTITAAIADAAGKATPANRYTVLVLPGTYMMDPMINDAANVDIIGLDRNNCIIYGTLTINNSILVENLTFDNTMTGGNGIDIATGNPTINNVKTIGGMSGINVQPTALGATVHNFECLQMTVAVNDEAGINIDGLRTDSQAFNINLMDPNAKFDYKNILQSSPGAPFGQISAGSGSLRSIKGEGQLNIINCGNLKIRDAHIKTSAGSAIFISGIEPFSKVEIYDAVLETDAGTAAQIGNFEIPTPIESPVLFNDVKFIAGNDGINAYYITNITVENCEIDAGDDGIECPKNVAENATAKLFVQTTIINANANGINLGGSTELWLYDTTINCVGNSVLGNTALPLTPPPRIADCRLETDTNPSQGSGTPGWNALMPLAGMGNVGGFGEDTAGNIVSPAAGLPVSP